MKRRWSVLLAGCAFACSLLAGCGSKPQEPVKEQGDEGNVGNAGVCTDETILSQLKNDGTPEFVLDGIYYTLPLEASKLVQAGWSLETEEYEAAEVMLQPGERIYGEFIRDEQELDAAIVNDGTEPCSPTEGGTVIELEYSAKKDMADPDFFVTLNGINCAMADDALQKALENVDGYKFSTAGNIAITRTVGDDELAVYKVMLMEDSTTITLASDNVFEYRDYQPQEVKQQESGEKTAAYQQTVQSEMEPYAENFDAIIDGYEENLSVGFYSEGTVWSKEVGEYKKLSGTPLSPDVSLYIAEDKTGQLYCVANQHLNEDGTVGEAVELEEGDQIRVWGYASQYLELQEGMKIVVVQPGIIERNGELLILDESLKVN